MISLVIGMFDARVKRCRSIRGAVEGQRLNSEGSMALKHPSNPSVRGRKRHFLTQSINDIADSLISPSDVLQLERLAFEQPKASAASYRAPRAMDKRHPSSFQQLEKVQYTLEYSLTQATEANINHSSERGRMPQYDRLQLVMYSPALTLSQGLQRSKPPDWRACGSQRNSLGLRGGDTFDSHTRDIVDEGAQTREYCIFTRCYPHRE